MGKMTHSSSNRKEKIKTCRHGSTGNCPECSIAVLDRLTANIKGTPALSRLLKQIEKETTPSQKKQKCSTTPGVEGGNQAYVLKSIGDTVNAHVVRKPPQNTGGSKPGGGGGGFFQIMPVWKIEFVDPPQKKDKHTYEETLETVRKLSKLMQKEGWEKEFDKKFVETDYHNGWTVPHVCISAERIKSFIKSLFKEERERIKKELLEVLERI